MKKILIIRFSSIGDIVLTSPVIRCLKKQTSAEIHYLTKEKYHTTLEHNPYLDQIHTIQKSVSEITAVLRSVKFDVIIDLHKNIRSWQVRLALNFPTTFAFSKVNFQKWLLINFKIDRMPNKHIVDRYLEAVRPLGVQNDGEGLDFFFPDNLTVPKGQYSVFAIGATHSTKRLPTEKIIAWCKIYPLQIILLGGNDVAEKGEKIASLAGEHVVNQCGKINLHQSAAWIKGARQVITHDTGMMHIAAAYRKEIVSIWGNTVPNLGMYPYYPKNMNRNTSMEVMGLNCRPCSKIGYDRCPRGHFKCMKEQSDEQFEQLVNILK